jgi:hypothetical protein
VQPVEAAFEGVRDLLANLSANATVQETVRVAAVATTILNNATLCAQDPSVQAAASDLRFNISSIIKQSVDANSTNGTYSGSTSLFSTLNSLTLDPSQVSNDTVSSIVGILNKTTDLVQSEERAQTFLSTISNLLQSRRPDVRVCVNGTYSNTTTVEPQFADSANVVLLPIRPQDAVRILDSFKGALASLVASLPCDTVTTLSSALAAAQVGSTSSYASFTAAPVNATSGVRFAVPTVTGLDLQSAGCLQFQAGQIAINPYENFRNITARNVTEGNKTDTFATK